MKYSKKYQIKCWGFLLLTTLTAMSFGAPVKPQSLHHAYALPFKEAGNSSQNISARDIFRDAYQNRYTWNSQFPGYAATVEVKQGKENYKGSIRLNSDLSVVVTNIDNKDIQQMVEDTLGTIAIHRRRVPFEVEHKDSTFKLGTTDKTGAVEIFEEGNKTSAHYKVLNRQLKQVNRLLGNAAVTVDVLNSEVTPEGYLATRYRTIFRQPQTNQVIGEEESKDTYNKIDGYYLLTHQVIHDVEQGQQTSTEINFTNIHLL